MIYQASVCSHSLVVLLLILCESMSRFNVAFVVSSFLISFLVFPTCAVARSSNIQNVSATITPVGWTLAAMS